MPGAEKKLKKLNKSHFLIAGVLVLLLLVGGLLLYNNSISMQAQPADIGQVYFDGEYRIADGEWQRIVAGEHIPSTKGDVTLRGKFHMLDPDGTYVGVLEYEIPIAFHVNHINLTFYEEGIEPISMDMENPLYGSSGCGVGWEAYTFTSCGASPIEILIHNPHSFGNETAIDELLAGVDLWMGIEFEKGVLESGEAQRNVGIIMILFSIVFLGIALFSTLIHIKNSRIIWLFGLVIVFAGLYLAFSASGVSFWNESTISNTTILGCSMMLYMLFLLMVISFSLDKMKPVGTVTTVAMAIVDAVLFVLPILIGVMFYDTWLWWAILQMTANAVFAVCLVIECFKTKSKMRWIYIGAILPLVSFGIDFVGEWLGIYSGGIASELVFVILLVAATVMVLRLIPHNINVATRAKELEMEKVALNAQLSESRVSTMISQIRPHFIYNTLGSIEQLCKLDPPKAGDLVHNFAKYLRGNFGELDNPKPILMSQEMEHVHHYINIENVRFPDMIFAFEMNSDDFKIPALTVQPIVENAIKHGLMKLQKGGTIRVVSYETDSDYCVSVTDDGVGFDTGAVFDDRKHVGLRNIRERLRVMVGGTLEIESTIGVGTKVLVKIPKEERK